jgi:hypothetical protein
MKRAMTDRNSSDRIIAHLYYFFRFPPNRKPDGQVKQSAFPTRGFNSFTVG